MTHSIEAGLDVERVLLEFPEVEHVVTRIGSPEVATDVMGIELSESGAAGSSNSSEFSHGFPSIAVITSPRSIPASSAGESSSTVPT